MESEISGFITEKQIFAFIPISYYQESGCNRKKVASAFLLLFFQVFAKVWIFGKSVINLAAKVRLFSIQQICGSFER